MSGNIPLLLTDQIPLHQKNALLLGAVFAIASSLNVEYWDRFESAMEKCGYDPSVAKSQADLIYWGLMAGFTMSLSGVALCVVFTFWAPRIALKEDGTLAVSPREGQIWEDWIFTGKLELFLIGLLSEGATLVILALGLYTLPRLLTPSSQICESNCGLGCSSVCGGLLSLTTSDLENQPRASFPLRLHLSSPGSFWCSTEC
jgi:hypothetical protein